MSGPSRSPFHRLAERGSKLARLRVAAQRVAATAADVPETLSGHPRARAKWNEIAPGLIAACSLSAEDLDALADYCLFWARREDATAVLSMRGMTYDVLDGEGRVKRTLPRPEVHLELKYAETCRLLRQRLGIDPVSRNNVEPLAETDAHDPTAEFMSDAG